MKKGLRGLACLLAPAVLLLGLPAGASAETWTATWTSASGTPWEGAVTNGSVILVAERYSSLYINGVLEGGGPLGDLVLPSRIDDFYNSFVIAAMAFSGNTTLTSITASSAVISIQNDAFQDCANLVYADLSASTMEYVNSEVFKGCTSLETVILPQTITEIYGEAFKDCTRSNRAIPFTPSSPSP